MITSNTNWRTVALHNLSEAEQEEFMEGFAQAARQRFPDYNIEEDVHSLSCRCRPWETEPVAFDVPCHPAVTPYMLGRLWFEAEEEDMAQERQLS